MYGVDICMKQGIYLYKYDARHKPQILHTYFSYISGNIEHMQETCLRALSSLVRLPQADAMPFSRLPMSFCMGFSLLVFKTGCVYGCVYT